MIFRNASLNHLSPKQYIRPPFHYLVAKSLPDSHRQRVMDLSSHADVESVLRHVELGDVWGVGRGLQQRLNEEGLRTALDLSRMSTHDIKQRYNVVLARTGDGRSGYEASFG